MRIDATIATNREMIGILMGKMIGKRMDSLKVGSPLSNPSDSIL
jgi:hypothetical protein